MVRWRVKGCPRCHGDMFIDRDFDSWYEQCLQCSYQVELKPLGVKQPVLAGERNSKKHVETREVSKTAK